LSQVDADPKKPRWKGLSHVRIDKNEALSGFRWSLFFNVINKFVLPLTMNAVVLRILGPEIGGPYAILYAIFAASDVLRDFGLSQTYMRDQEMNPRKEASYMMLGILQGLVPASLLFACREQFAAYYQNPVLSGLLIWICLGLVINGFWTIPKAKILQLGRIRESGARETVANVVQVVLSVWMVFHGYTYLAMVFPLFINCVLNVAITYGLAPVTDFRFDLSTMKRTLRTSASTLGASALYNIYIQSDKFIIGKLAGADVAQANIAVGLYSQAQGLAQKPMQLLSVPMMAPLQAAFSQNSNNPEKIGSIYGRALAAALIFIVPLYAMAMVAAEPVTLLILGHKWRGSIPLVQICSVFFAARTLGTIGGTALVAGGKARFAMASWAFCYATAAVGCVVAARSGSVEAFAWAFSAGALVVYAVHTIFAFRWFTPDRAAQAKLRSAALITVLSCLFFSAVYFLPFSPWLDLAIAGALGPLVHLALTGWLLAQRPLEYLSLKGPKRLLQLL
jgi:O-antigen/teichoic acid export membrane protein